MKLLLCPFLLFVILGSHIVHAQIGINGSAHPSAALDVKSPGNDKAFYPPRLTTAQRLAIPNPQAGAFVYDLDKGTMYLNDGQNWLPLATTDRPLAERLVMEVHLIPSVLVWPFRAIMPSLDRLINTTM